MDSDQRLEALTRNSEKHDKQIEALLAIGAQHDARIAKLTDLVTQIAEGTARLPHTA